MTLVISLFAAVTCTVIWYLSEKARVCKVGTLCYMFWGASIMWLVDAIAEYIELGAEYFSPAVEDMINDSYLGVSVVLFGLIIWVVILLVKDPLKTVRKALVK